MITKEGNVDTKFSGGNWKAGIFLEGKKDGM